MMDISPMSLQAIVPRSSEATQVQHNMNQHAVVQQDFQAVQEKADAELKQKQVREREEMEDGKVKDDPDRQQGRGQYSSGKRRGRPGQDAGVQETLAVAVDNYRGHNIDISF